MTPMRSLVILSVTIGVVGLSVATPQQPGASQPGTLWSEAQLREAVGTARVGRRLTPTSWPNGARVAVSLSFDADSEAEPYEIKSRGKPTGIVELPIDWTLTETPFLGQNGRMPNTAFL